MFSLAYATAKHFTWPIVLSRLTQAGRCSSTIAAITILNSDGWFLTAAHIFSMLDEMLRGEARALEHESKVAFRLSGRTSPGAALVAAPDADETRRASAWWGRDEPRLVSAFYVEAIDLGVGRLQPFDPAWVGAYPTIKNPAVDFEPGTSLCRLGFPFHAITPRFEEPGGRFVLPEGSTPIPLFPVEGILTRLGVILPPMEKSLPYPLMQIETSSPGLRGQSGGPIVDTMGRVWGIQSVTRHLPLGFDPEVADTGGIAREHQFLNVGVGVHAATIVGMLGELGVRFQMSPD